MAAAYQADKGVEKSFPPRCVVDLWVKLDAVKIARHVLDRCDRRIVCVADDFKVGQWFSDDNRWSINNCQGNNTPPVYF